MCSAGCPGPGRGDHRLVGQDHTKDLIATLLEDLGPTVAPAGSFNTEVGLPLTSCGPTEDTRFLVLEMGARGVGHVATLCRIAPPDVSVVLNVGSAHLGEFGSREAIGQAKGEIVEALAADGAGRAQRRRPDRGRDGPAHPWRRSSRSGPARPPTSAPSG